MSNVTEPRNSIKSHILLVEDEPQLARAHARALTIAGHDVQTASDGNEAMERFVASSFDVIVSDIAMPGMNGIQLLKAVRAHDLDIPVLLITGRPSLETATAAVEFGALRYLTKPTPVAELERLVDEAVLQHRLSRIRRETLAQSGGDGVPIEGRASLNTRFARALDSLHMAFQPIIRYSETAIFGYEALLRTEEQSLANPSRFLGAAERLGRLPDLGRAIRRRVASVAHQAPQEALLFVNLHPLDLIDPKLYLEGSPLAAIAGRVVLEITERASLEQSRDLSDQVTRLRQLGFRIAVDDLGAGYAGLSTVALLRPDVVKIDMSLVRGIGGDPTKQKIVGSIVDLCGKLDVRVIAEGVETPAERDALHGIGIDLFQGYLFGKAQFGFSAPMF